MEHYHKCPCGTVWKHDASRIDDMEAAHRCPGCGRDVPQYRTWESDLTEEEMAGAVLHEGPQEPIPSGRAP